MDESDISRMRVEAREKAEEKRRKELQWLISWRTSHIDLLEYKHQSLDEYLKQCAAQKPKPAGDLKVGGTTTIIVDLREIDLMIERGLLEKQIWDHKNTLNNENDELKNLTKSTS